MARRKYGGEQGSNAFYVSGEDLLHEWEKKKNRIQSDGWGRAIAGEAWVSMRAHRKMRPHAWALMACKGIWQAMTLQAIAL